MERNAKPRIIGGMFGLEAVPNPNHSPPPFLNDRDILLANARSGISLLVELLSPPQVWMPSYLCGSMLKATGKRRMTAKFYEVNYDLAIPSLEWLDDVRPNDLIVLIDYFGFPCDASCATAAKDQGAWILEDACQALLSKSVGQLADFVLFGPRKFLGVPDGGILTLDHRIEFDGIKLTSPPAEWWLKALSARVLRREFDLHGGSRRWFEVFQEAEAENPIGHYAMSELSRILLTHSFDYSTIAQRRVENFRFLANALSDIALFPTFLPSVVPLGFPIRVKNRDPVRQTLFDHGIYPPVHWPIQDIVPGKFRDSHRLAAEIMTLPCDQRYDSSDMERMARLVREALGQ